MEYIIKGVEDVYDSFDEYEGANPVTSFPLEASSLEEAIKKGEQELQRKINRKRMERGFVSSVDCCGGSSGTYLARLLEISLNGRVVHQPRDKRGMEIGSGDL